MDARTLKELRQELEEEKQGLLAQIAGLENALTSTLSESVGELSVCDNHPADIGDELFERSKDIGLRDNAQVLLESVEDALQKINKEDYGCCDVCGKPIPLERLEAVPWARECIHCQRREDLADRGERPLEEQVLTPPFQRTFLDDDPLDSVGFDGEDALQAVMSYGSSDTPQDISGSHDYNDLFFNSHENDGVGDSAETIIDHSYRHTHREK